MKLPAIALLVLPFLLPVARAAAPVKNVIIDTDAGSDDLIAIAFLLARHDVQIEAITIVNGIAHVPAGAVNVLRLLALAGRADIPVYLGRAAPLDGTAEFPEFWRMTADALPNVELPQTERKPEPASALAYLRGRLANAGKPVSVLALGPLTNIAEVLTAAPQSVLAIGDLVVMGGAVRVEGNMPSAGYLYSDKRTAEWNIYVDPAAAQKVFDTVTRCRLVPLDASNTVPFDLQFLEQFRKRAKSKMGAFVAQVLASNRTLIEQRIFFAWHPLAAVALVNPAVLKISSVPLTVIQKDADTGRTAEGAGGRSVRAALAADAELFRKVFIDTLR